MYHANAANNNAVIRKIKSNPRDFKIKKLRFKTDELAEKTEIKHACIDTLTVARFYYEHVMRYQGD